VIELSPHPKVVVAARIRVGLTLVEWIIVEILLAHLAWMSVVTYWQTGLAPERVNIVDILLARRGVA
jgi:hypothetical protein